MVLHEKYAKEPWRHIGLKVPHHGGPPPPDEQNQLLQDQIQCTIPTPDCNTFLLKQGELR